MSKLLNQKTYISGVASFAKSIELWRINVLWSSQHEGGFDENVATMATTSINKSAIVKI